MASITGYTKAAIDTLLADKFYLDVRDYGAVGDGTTDDSAAFAAALADAASKGGRTIFVPSTPNGYYLTQGLAWDVRNAAFLGDATLLKFPASFAGVAVQPYSAATYTQMNRNARPAFAGFHLTAGGQFSQAPGTAFKLGHATNVDNGNIVIRDCHAQGFATLLGATDNAWRYRLEQVHLRWGSVTIPASLANMGEQMTVVACMWDGLDAATFGCGSWQFDSCSFDNVPIEVNGDCQLWLDTPHFENPGSSSSGYRMLAITHSAGMIKAKNARLVINQPSGGGDWQWAPFYVDPSNTTYGLDIDGLWLLQAGYLKYEVHDSVRCLTAGGGKANIRNVSSNNNFNGYALAQWSNRLRNGDAELGATTGWSKTGTGTHTVDTTSGNRQSGTYSHKVSCTTGQTALVYQDITVTPGQYLWATIWRKLSLGTGGSGGEVFTFFDQAGNFIGSVGTETLSVTTAGAVRSGLSGIVPAGAVRARLEISVAGGSAGTTDFWFDNAIVNVA